MLSLFNESMTHCRYVDKSFIEMLLEYSSTEYMHLVQNAIFDWLLWKPNGYISKNMTTKRIKYILKLLYLFTQVSKCGPWASCSSKLVQQNNT